jgi:hypothetical protein
VTVQQLQTAGYNVSIKWLEGHPNVPLKECKLTGISGLNGSTTSTDVMAVMNAWLPVGPRVATRPSAVSRAPFDAELAHY